MPAEHHAAPCLTRRPRGETAAPDFFSRPILNSPYEYPSRHWELDSTGQPTHRILEHRRKAEFVTPIPKPKKRKGGKQKELILDEGQGLSTEAQRYDPTPLINELRKRVDAWRDLKNPDHWGVTPETRRLLQHWRHHRFSGIRPFFTTTPSSGANVSRSRRAPAGSCRAGAAS